jgi:hypothetical protein
MEAGLRQLFPSDFAYGDPLSEFKNTATGLNASGSRALGFLVRTRNSLLPLKQKVISDLPECVDRAFVKLHKILPSAFAVTVEFILDQKFSDELKRLQSIRRLPPVRFRHYIPWGWRVHNRVEGSAEYEIQRSVTDRMTQLRVSLEQVIAPYIHGYFASQRFEDWPTRLPAIEIFTLTGAPNETIAFSKWLDGAIDWLETYGTSRPSFLWFGYSNNKIVFTCEPSNFLRTYPAQYRLFVLGEESTDSSGADSLVFRLDDTLSAIVPFVALVEFLDRTEIAVAKLRQQVYERLRGAGDANSLSADFRISELIERDGACQRP